MRDPRIITSRNKCFRMFVMMKNLVSLEGIITWKETNVKVKVCKTMFLNTLGLRKGVVNKAITKRTPENTSELVRKCRHIKKLTVDVLNSVRRNIETSPVVESHYCRSDSKGNIWIQANWKWLSHLHIERFLTFIFKRSMSYLYDL